MIRFWQKLYRQKVVVYSYTDSHIGVVDLSILENEHIRLLHNFLGLPIVLLLAPLLRSFAKGGATTRTQGVLQGRRTKIFPPNMVESLEYHHNHTTLDTPVR